MTTCAISQYRIWRGGAAGHAGNYWLRADRARRFGPRNQSAGQRRAGDQRTRRRRRIDWAATPELAAGQAGSGTAVQRVSRTRHGLLARPPDAFAGAMPVRRRPACRSRTPIRRSSPISAKRWPKRAGASVAQRIARRLPRASTCIYVDVWTDPDPAAANRAADLPFSYLYADLTTTAPVSTPASRPGSRRSRRLPTVIQLRSAYPSALERAEAGRRRRHRCDLHGLPYDARRCTGSGGPARADRRSVERRARPLPRLSGIAAPAINEQELVGGALQDRLVQIGVDPVTGLPIFDSRAGRAVDVRRPAQMRRRLFQSLRGPGRRDPQRSDDRCGTAPDCRMARYRWPVFQ